MHTEGLHSINSLATVQVVPQTMLDEIEFLRYFKPFFNGENCYGLMMDDKDILFDIDSSFIQSLQENQIWSLLEDDCGDAYLLGAKVENAVGYVCCKTPRDNYELMKVEFEGF
jgi:hypothetical protein